MAVAKYEVSFEGGLLQQYPRFHEVLQASVSGCGKPLKVVAADIDMTSSELSRKLASNPNDNVHFPAEKLDALMASTGDYRPIFWLIERFLADPDAKRKHAIEELNALLPRIQQLLVESSQP